MLRAAAFRYVRINKTIFICHHINIDNLAIKSLHAHQFHHFTRQLPLAILAKDPGIRLILSVNVHHSFPVWTMATRVGRQRPSRLLNLNKSPSDMKKVYVTTCICTRTVHMLMNLQHSFQCRQFASTTHSSRDPVAHLQARLQGEHRPHLLQKQRLGTPL
jgi:hypothetical protein